MSRCVAVYISGHGYGHLAQIAPVLDALVRRCPDVSLLLRTRLPVALLSRRIRAPFTLLADAVDVGVVQKNAISEDIPATLEAARAFYKDFDERIEREAKLLAKLHPVAVLSDISPLAFPVAKRVGAPCFAVASLDWHEIYRAYLPADDPLLATLQKAHDDCDLLIRPPLSMPMPTFAERREVEIIVDDAYTAPKPARDAEHRTALVMFGGAGDPPFNVRALEDIAGWRFLSLSRIPSGASANVKQAVFRDSTAELVQGCELVITKPGYGTLAECWQTNTPLAYVPREEFPEYPHLDDWLQKNAPSARMQMEDFVSGNWREAMQAALDCPRSWPQIKTSGAEQAVELIARALPQP